MRSGSGICTLIVRLELIDEIESLEEDLVVPLLNYSTYPTNTVSNFGTVKKIIIIK